MNLISIILAIFAAPIMKVIGLLLVIVIAAWVLWAILTKFVPPEPQFTRNIGYVVYVIVVGLLLIYWCDFAFGLGLF